MAGLISFAVGGLAYVLIGAHEYLAPFLLTPAAATAASSSSFRYASALALSLLYILRSLYLALSSSPLRRDPVALPLQLSSSAAASAFFLFSLSGLFRSRLRLSRAVLDFLLLSAFGVELLLIRLSARGDTSGIERRYFDLLLVPVLVCAASTLLALARPGSLSPLLARGIALVLHGTWLIQMGFSFFSSAIAHGCALQRRSWGNYTIKCKGHPEYHRGRAIATLQFNCHLAFLAVVTACVYSVVARLESGARGAAEYVKYRPLNEMQRTMGDHNHSNNSHHAASFTLESDDDDDDIGINAVENKKEAMSSGEIAEAKQQHEESEAVVALPKEGANGFGDASH